MCETGVVSMYSSGQQVSDQVPSCRSAKMSFGPPQSPEFACVVLAIEEVLPAKFIGRALESDGDVELRAAME